MLVTILSLYCLAVLDGCFGALCAASGRNALIHKKIFYANALWKGALWSQVACLVGLLMIVVCVWASDDRNACYTELQRVGWRMAQVLGSYAFVVWAMFLIRAIPSVDVRSATSTLAFGPLTLIHPAVVFAATVWGMYELPSTPVIVATLMVGIVMLTFRDGMCVILGRYYRSQQY
jgi:hypothetical protein